MRPSCSASTLRPYAPALDRHTADEVQNIIGRSTYNFKSRLGQAHPRREYPSMAIDLKRCFLVTIASAFLTIEGNAITIREGAARRSACRLVPRRPLNGAAKP